MKNVVVLIIKMTLFTMLISAYCIEKRFNV